jgi:hypothetical protein
MWFRRIALGVVLLLGAAQFIPVDRSNRPVDPGKTFYTTENVPPKVQALLDRSCTDCHTNQTRWPWYNGIAPISWVVANDVHSARRKLNFSEWGNYSAKKRDHEKEEICDEVMEGDMPDGKYAFVHPKSKLTTDERAAICEWTGSPRQ